MWQFHINRERNSVIFIHKENPICVIVWGKLGIPQLRMRANFLPYLRNRDITDVLVAITGNATIEIVKHLAQEAGMEEI